MNEQDMKQIDLQIDKYLRQEMPIEEMRSFEILMEKDESLAQEVSLRYDIMMGIRAAEQRAILQHLQNTPVRKNTLKNTSNPYRWVWIVMAIMILVLFFWIVSKFI